MKRVLVIDNYDSFTFNLVHYLEALGSDVTVFRNDAFDLEEVRHFDKIVLSPGPGIPDEAGLLKAVIREYATTKSILGICLGQQAIAEVFGGSISNMEKVYHGVATRIKITVPNEVLFENLGDTLEVGRYHSWIVNRELPEILEATSVDQTGSIMSLRHKKLDVKGLQFHPESILTPQGKQILQNWLCS